MQLLRCVLLLACTAAVGTQSADGASSIASAAEAAWTSILMGTEGRQLSDGVRALLMAELAQVGEQTWGKRWAMHRTLDFTHDAAASLALAEAAQLVESLREAVANGAPEEGPQDKDSKVCKPEDPDACSAPDLVSLPPGARAWASSIVAVQPAASPSALRTLRMELNKTAASAWENDKGTRRALDKVYEALASETLAMVADVVRTVREKVDTIVMQDKVQSKNGQPRRYLVREAAVGLAWDAQAAAMSGRMGGLHDDKCDSVEAGQSAGALLCVCTCACASACASA